jgi:predicted RNA-binding Zn-ribbon protein involved in translation (DUF1610 family)
MVAAAETPMESLSTRTGIQKSIRHQRKNEMVFENILKENKVDIPFLVCKRKIVHQCEMCGREIVLPDEQPREYKCQNCGTEFRTEVMDDGTLGIILTPIDNTNAVLGAGDASPKDLPGRRF